MYFIIHYRFQKAVKIASDDRLEFDLQFIFQFQVNINSNPDVVILHKMEGYKVSSIT